jgi:hypothetical protein
MPGDQQIVRALDPDHFYSHQNGSDHDGMHAVDSNAVHPLQPGQRTSVLGYKARIGAQICDCAARFNPPQNIHPGEVLVFNRNCWLTINASAAQVLQSDGWQSQTLPGQDFPVA